MGLFHMATKTCFAPPELASNAHQLEARGSNSIVFDQHGRRVTKVQAGEQKQ